MTRAQDRILVQEHLAHQAEPKPLSDSEKADLEARIKDALKAKDAVLVAHSSPAPDIQRLAEEPVAVWQTRWKWPASATSIPRLRLWWQASASWARPPRSLTRKSVCLCPPWKRPARWMWAARRTSSPSSATSIRTGPWWSTPILRRP